MGVPLAVVVNRAPACRCARTVATHMYTDLLAEVDDLLVAVPRAFACKIVNQLLRVGMGQLTLAWLEVVVTGNVLTLFARVELGSRGWDFAT